MFAITKIEGDLQIQLGNLEELCSTGIALISFHNKFLSQGIIMMKGQSNFNIYFYGKRIRDAYTCIYIRGIDPTHTFRIQV